MELFKLFGTIAVNNSEANKSIDDTTGKANTAQSKMVSAFKKIGSAVVTYMAVDKIVSFGKSCVDAAVAIAAETASFDQIMGDYADNAQKKIQEVADTTGIVDGRLTGYMTSMTAKFQGLGYDIDKATTLAQDGLIVAADAAAFWDKSMEDSMSSLNSFINGNYEGGEAIGLFANETTLASWAAENLGFEWKNLSEAEKQFARLEFAKAMQETSGVTGQAANEADAYANVTGNLKRVWEEFIAVIGQPVLEAIIPIVKNLASKITSLTDKFKNGQNPVQVLGDKIKSLKNWFANIGDYASKTLEPIIKDVGTAFTTVKNALQPFIDKIAEYVTSGEAAEDITNLVKGAIDLLAEGYETLCGWIESVVDWFISASEWIGEHKTQLELIAIAVGTLTTAIIAYNAAMAIKNAGGVAELAQLALLQVQMWGLTAAETAHTAATTIATAATTAFGAAVSFLTSPITLVILAIGALVAAGVVLAKHWDDIKAKATQIFQSVADWISEKVKSIKGFFSDAKDAIVEKFSNIGSWFGERWQDIKNVFANVGSWFGDKFLGAWAKVKGAFSTVREFFTGIFDTIKGIFKNIGSSIGDAVSTAFSSAVNWVLEKAVGLINGFISALNAAIGVINAIPGVKISKISQLAIPQLEEGGVLEKGQIGLLEGNGAEAVVPLDQNKKWIHAVAEDIRREMPSVGDDASGIMPSKMDALLDMAQQMMSRMDALLDMVQARAGMQVCLDSGALVGELTPLIDSSLGEVDDLRKRGG